MESDPPTTSAPGQEPQENGDETKAVTDKPSDESFWTSSKFLGAAGGAVAVLILTAAASYMFGRIGVLIGVFLLVAYLGATAYFFR